MIDVGRPDLDPMVLSITHQLGWRIEPHRLRVEDRGQEHLGMVALYPRRGVGDQRE